MRCNGEGPQFIRFKRKILYDARDLEEWIQKHKVKTIDTIK